jgi:hypothetical protein
MANIQNIYILNDNELFPFCIDFVFPQSRTRILPDLMSCMSNTMVVWVTQWL